MNRKSFAPVLVWMIGRDGQANYFSAGWLAQTGKTLEQTIKEGWLEDIHPDDREFLVRLVSTRPAVCSEHSVIFRLRQSTGSYSPAAGLIHPYHLPGGDFAGWVGSAVFTTDDEATGAIFGHISKNMREIVCLISNDTRILYVSPAVETILGYSPEEITGQPLINFFQDIDKTPGFQDYFSSIHLVEDLKYFEICLPKKTGEMVWLEMDLQFLREENGVLLNLQVVARDITIRKHNEEILRVHNEIAAILLETSDLKTSLDQVLKIVLTFEGIDCGGVYVVGPQSRQLNLISHTGLGQEFIENAGSYPSDHFLAKLAYACSPIYGFLPDILKELDPDEMKGYEKENLLGFAAIPMVYKNDLIALFSLGSHKLAEIPQHSRQIIEFLARQIGSLIARNRAETALRENEEKFRGFFEQTTDTFSLVDENGIIIEWNPASEALTGLLKAEVIGRLSVDVQFDLLPPAKKSAVMYRKMVERYASIQSSGKASFFNQILEGQILDKTGHLRYFQQIIFPIHTTRGVMLGSSGRDVTPLKRIEQAELEQRQLTEALIVSSSVLNSSLKLDDIFERIFELVGKIVPIDGGSLMLIDPETKTIQIIGAIGSQEELLKADTGNHKISIRNIPVFKHLFETTKPLIIPDTNKSPLWKQHHEQYGMHSFLGVPICIDRKIIGFLNLHSAEIDYFQPKHAEWLQAFANQAALAIENARLFARVEQLAVQDELTHVYNRRGFKEIGDREVERALRFNHPLAALFLDVDHFKEINDAYSHAVGDQVLQGVVSCFYESLRSVDVIGRYGGEEFVFLLPETDLNGARMIAERLRSEIEKTTISTSQGDLRVTVSIGVSCLSRGILTLEALLDKADAAVHRAKAAGRNRVEVG